MKSNNNPLEFEFHPFSKGNCICIRENIKRFLACSNLNHRKLFAGMFSTD